MRPRYNIGLIRHYPLPVGDGFLLLLFSVILYILVADRRQIRGIFNSYN